eukprot:6191896-Pleurochrysis_carterae.AAC.1
MCGISAYALRWRARTPTSGSARPNFQRSHLLGLGRRSCVSRGTGRRDVRANTFDAPPGRIGRQYTAPRRRHVPRLGGTMVAPRRPARRQNHHCATAPRQTESRVADNVRLRAESVVHARARVLPSPTRRKHYCETAL